MQIVEFPVDTFETTETLLSADIETNQLQTPRESVAIYGGAARSAVFEATQGVVLAVRDIDVIAIGEEYLGTDYASIVRRVNPEADYNNLSKNHYSRISDLLSERVDFTVNQSAIILGQNPRLATTTKAIHDISSKVVTPTVERVNETRVLQRSRRIYESERYLGLLTDMPARGAYFTAVFRAAGLDFELEMGDQPRPKNPQQTDDFYLGLMAKKALEVDELERGEGDVTATMLMIEIFRELNLTERKAKTASDVIQFGKAILADFPDLQFAGTSTIGDLIERRQ